MTDNTHEADVRQQHPVRLRGPRGISISASAVLAWLVLALMLAWTIAPAWFAPFDPLAQDATPLLPPSTAHAFGTDAVGRDLFSRVVWGARESLAGAAIAVTVGVTAGALLGAVAASIGGPVDAVLMRVVDVLLAVPTMLLALTVVVLLGSGTVNAAIAIGVGSVAAFARLTRAEVLQVRRSEYVEAAYGSGGTFLTVLREHILPNSLRPIIALLAFQFGGAVLALSALGFLGYGVTPPAPEWGMIIAQGRNLLGAAWWLTGLPGLVLLILVLATNRLSRTIGGAA